MRSKRIYLLGILALLSALMIAFSLLSVGATHAASSSSQGKKIVVSISHQWLWAYQNGREVYNSAVTTGRPGLATPTGTYHVFQKVRSVVFRSSWPRSSPYWYAPEYVHYALEWGIGVGGAGLYMHDSSWRSVYGPGTNRWHYDPKYGWEWGSHGCINMPVSASAWLYNWAPVGTTVRINA